MLCADLIYELYLQSTRKDVPKSLFLRDYFRHRWLNIHQTVSYPDPSTVKPKEFDEETKIPETVSILKEDDKNIFARREYNFQNATMVAEYDDLLTITTIAYLFTEGKLQSITLLKREIKY